MNNTNELNKWVVRLQRKLDAMALSKLDREELEEILSIILRLVEQQLVVPVEPPGAETEGKPRRGKRETES